MPGPDFLDTNVLVQAYDPGDPKKQRVAQDLVRRAMAGELVISSQVLAEFASALGPIRIVAPDANTVRRAVEARAQYGVHFYFGMIVAAAELAGCQRIWSEDFHAGQRYFGIEMVNPFR